MLILQPTSDGTQLTVETASADNADDLLGLRLDVCALEGRPHVRARGARSGSTR